MDTFFENKFITTKNAEDISGYTSDYLARLARLGKISAKRIGHSWFIEKESLARFMEQQETRKADHIRTLTRERAEEYLLHQDVRRDALHQDSQQEVARNSLLKRVAGNFINPVPVSPSQFFFPESPLRSQIRAALVALVVITSSALVAQVITSPSITKGTSHFINEISSAIGTTFGSVPGYVTDQAIVGLGDTAVPITNTRVRDSLLLATDSGGVTVFAGNVHDVTSSVFKDLNFSSIQTSFRKVSEDAANAPTKFASRIRTTPILSPSEIAQAVRFSAAAAYSIVTTPSVIVRAIGHSYIAIGTEAYGIINKSFSGYQDIIARSGGKTFDAAITVRDLLVLMPSFITRMNLAFGNVVIDSAYFAIRTDVSLAYWVARMAPESARVTFMAIGSVGDMLARVAEGTPSLATALFLRTTAAPAVLAPEISKTIVEAGYEGATHFVRTANFIAEGYLSAILGAGRIAYAGAVGAMTASRATTSLVVSLPARMQDAYLGALGKTALAFESVDSLSHPPKQSLLAAVFPTLSIGEQAALFTYQTVRNLFTSTGEVLSGLLGSSSDVSIVSNPPSVVLPFASSTVSNIVLTQAPPSKEEVPESAAVSAQQARTRIAISPPTSSPAQPAAINNYPTYTTVVKGVSEDFLNQSLASMRTGILASVAGMIQPVAAQTAANITTIQQVNMIQDLSNLIVRNGDFRGGTFSGGSLTSGVSVSATTGSFENLTISGTGTTTSAGGLNLSSGCFAVDGTCITGGGGGGVTSLTATYPLLTTGATGGITISTAFGTTTANTFSALNIFNANASTTQLTTTGATYLATLGGNVGIGTTTPGTLLSLGNTGANTVNISATATSTFGSGINVLTGCFAVNGTCVGGGSGSGTVGSGTIGQFPYYAANGTTLTATSSLFLATSGNVGIGTTTPWAQLSVNPNGITGPAFVIGSSTATNFIVTNGGDVGVGMTTPTQKLDVTGNINTSAGSAYMYNGSNVITASTTLANYFFGGAGNLTMTGVSNTALGLQALYSNTSGYSNTATGKQALYSNLAGTWNTANGVSALFANTSGSGNSAFGEYALNANTSGSNNSALGEQALLSNTTGSGNTAAGVDALNELNITANNGTGNNTAIGYNTGRGIVTGVNNTILGANITGLAAALSNNIIIADGAGNRRINVGSTGNVGIGTTTPYSLLSLSNSATTAVDTPLFTIASTTGGTSTSTLMTVLANGNIGIGTASPSVKIEVAGTDSTNSLLVSGGSLKVTGQDSNGHQITMTGNGSINASGAGQFAAGTSLTLAAGSANAVIISANGAERMRAASTGNIGIGTTTPWAQLSVNPNGITGPAFVIGSSTATNFVVTNGGNVGIGTAAPVYPLDVRSGDSFPLNVVSGSYGLLRLESTGGASEGWLSVTLANSVAPFRIVTSNSSPITLDPGGNERVRVTSGGNVGIGTTTPGTLLSLGNTGNDTVNISATATSTFGSGLSIRTGCFAINGTCLSTGGSGTVTSIATNNGLTGGTITTSGTIGLAAIAANSVLGNITGSSGVPSAIATSSLFQNASASLSGLLTSTDWSTFNNKQAALTFTYPLINTTNTISTAFGTTTANTFSALNIFNANASTTQLTSTGAAYLATTGGNVGIGTTVSTQKLDVAGFINTDQYSGYKQAGNTVLYASTTNASVAIGASAAAAWMAATSTLFYGTAAGQGALSTAPTADGQDSNSAFGYNALFNTIAANNTAIGKTALYTNSTGVSNTASGVRALYSNSSGGYNTATGNAALYNSINGSNNSADGVQALYYNTASSNVSALGYAAAQGTGNYSNQGGVYVGSQSGYSAATGSDYNTFLGYQAGYSVTSGGYNIIIGQNVDAPVVTGNQQLNIGNLIYGTSVYGGSSVSSTPVNGRIGIGTTTPWAQLSVNPNGITGPAFVIGSSTATNFVVTNGGNVGIGTTTPWRKLSIEGSSDLGTNALAGSFTATSTTATTTLAGFLDVNGTGTNATSTFASNLWVKGTLKIGLASIYLTDGGIRSTDGTVNITSGATATSTVSGYFGIGTTSPYRALSVAGSGVFTGGDVLTSTLTATSSITAASLSLTTALPVSSGGTGQTTFTSSQLLYGNGTSALSSVGTSTLATGTGLTSSGTLGYQVGGTNSTLSFASIAANSLWANPTGASAVPQVIATSSLFQNASASLSGLLTSTDWSTFNNKQAALTFTYPLINTTNTISTAFGTTTANTFSALNIFNANASTTQLTSTGAAYLATTGGKVGIGTTSPYSLLSLSNSATTAVNTPLFTIASTTGGTSTSTLMTVLANGNVGIGTASPTYKFQLVGPGTGQLNAMFENDGDQAILNFNAWGSQAWHSGSFSASRGRGTKASPDYPSNGDNLFSMNMGGWQGTEMATDNGIRIAFQADGTWTSASTPGMITFSVNDGTTAWNGGAQSMVFRSTGNLGIGEASPGSKLSVSGGATIGASYSTTAAPTNGLLVQGNTGIGTTSPATLLEVGGSTANVTFDGYKNCTGFTSNANGLVACTASDQRLKQDVLSLEGVNGLAAINALNPVSFYWKPEANRSPQQQFGLIAQQVQGVFPNLVATSSPTSLTPDGTLSVNYEGLISPMVRAIQQLDARTNFMQSATTSPVLTVDVAGNIGIGTTTPNHTLTVAGDVAAIAFVNTSTRSAKDDISYVTASSSEEMLNHLMGLKVATYRYKMEGQNDPLRLGLIAEDAQTVAPEILSVDGKGVDIYKLATFTLSGVQTLAAKLDVEHMRVTALEDRVAALESGAVSSATGSPISFSTTSLASALSSFGIVVQKSIAQFDTLVARQFVASKDADGTSSAGTATILTGNTVAQVNNSLVKSSTKVFVTFNSQIQGNWWVNDKTDGSFRVTLSTQQSSDVSFDYFLVQTEGQIMSPSSTTTSPNNAVAGLPGITLLGDNPIHIPVGAVFTDPGVIITGAADAANPYTTFIDGIERTVSSTTISTESPTTYIITYVATNTAGDSSTKMRSVIVGDPDGTVSTGTASGGSGVSVVTASTTVVSASVVETTAATTITSTTTPADVTPPAVTLVGSAAMQINVGDVFTDPGATASDVVDGDLTSKIVTKGSIDVLKSGLYTLTYSATDAAGNTGSVSRVVTNVATSTP